MVKTEAETSLSRTAELLLVRLLVIGKSSPGPKKLRDELGRLGASLSSDDDVTVLRASRQSAGLLENGRRLELTEAGRARALQVLGIAALPPRVTWPQLRDRHLIG